MEASPPPFRLDSKAGLYVDGWPLTSKIFSESGLSSLLTPSLSTEIYFASSLPPSFSLSFQPHHTHCLRTPRARSRPLTAAYFPCFFRDVSLYRSSVVYLVWFFVCLGPVSPTQCFQPKNIRIRKTEYSTPKTRFCKFEY